MIPLAISSATQALFHATLTDHHTRYTTIRVLDLNGNRLSTDSWRLLDGQVDVDATQTVTRSCGLQLLDPNRSMVFDSASPVAGALYLDRMIQAFYSVRTAAGWVDVPVFTGPVTELERSDDVVQIAAQGKEVLALHQVWNPLTYKEGTLKVDVIRAILRDRAGETKFTFPSSTARLPTDYAVGRMNTPWGVAQHIAQGMGLQLFYDGRGVCRLRPLPKTSVYHFRPGDNGAVMTAPRIKYGLEGLKNTIWVRGAASTATGGTFGTAKIGAVAHAPNSHSLSAARLGRDVNGVRIPRHLVEEYVNSSIMSNAEAQRFANSILSARLLQSIDVMFDSMPIPHLEPEDIARLITDEFSSAFRMRRFSIPLVVRPGAHMAVGYKSRLSRPVRRGRR